MIKSICIASACFFLSNLAAQTYSKATEFRDVTIDAEITNVQPMTGIVFWQGSETNTNAISLEFSYMLFNDVVTDSGRYNWALVEQKLNDISSRNHQAIFRFRDTYVGKETSVPDYIKKRKDYFETEGISEGQSTWFPDWTNQELQRFIIEFYTRFAEKYDNDPRLAFIQVGFGLWGEYHIYDGPFILGKTFPAKAYQEKFLNHLDSVFKYTPWSISIDAADNTYSPFEEKPVLLNLKFGNFDDSFMCEGHDGYNETCWIFFGTSRHIASPAGGEFSYYTDYDQEHVLDYPNGAHGKSYEEMAAKFHITYIIGNDQPSYQSIDRIKEASMASGYKFKIGWVKTKTDSTILEIKNIGIAPFYYDAFPTVNGVRSPESLKNLGPGMSKEFHISAGGEPFELSIKSDRLLAAQRIDYYGTNYNSVDDNKINKSDWYIFPTVVKQGENLAISNTVNDISDFLINILNSHGRLIKILKPESGQFILDTSSFPKGLYWVQIFQPAHQAITNRFIVL